MKWVTLLMSFGLSCFAVDLERVQWAGFFGHEGVSYFPAQHSYGEPPARPNGKEVLPLGEDLRRHFVWQAWDSSVSEKTDKIAAQFLQKNLKPRYQAEADRLVKACMAFKDSPFLPPYTEQGMKDREAMKALAEEIAAFYDEQLANEFSEIKVVVKPPKYRPNSINAQRLLSLFEDRFLITYVVPCRISVTLLDTTEDRNPRLVELSLDPIPWSKVYKPRVEDEEIPILKVGIQSLLDVSTQSIERRFYGLSRRGLDSMHPYDVIDEYMHRYYRNHQRKFQRDVLP